MFNGREMSKRQNTTTIEEQNFKSKTDKDGSCIKKYFIFEPKKAIFFDYTNKRSIQKNIIIQIISFLKKFHLEHKFYFLYSSI